MAKYTSRYPELMFYVNDELKRFSNGVYVTEDKDEVAVLDALIDAVKVDEPKPQAKTKSTEADAKPAAKAPSRKASAK